MNREFKFKVWDKEQKKFLEINWEGEDTRHTKGKANICYSDHVYVTLSGYVNEDGWPYEVDADILQYTGLKDKDNKEIYEGDIIKKTMKLFLNTEMFVWSKEVMKEHTKGEDGRYYKFKYRFFEIKWDSKTARFIAYEHSTGEEISLDDAMFLFVEDDFEVIGNIYENPELLGGEEYVASIN